MLVVRRAEERGHAEHGWLTSHHTFSFADYYDPRHMGFGSLRVINDDTVAGGGGFPSHSHRDMEIISYVISGALRHKDSMGNGSVIRPGDVQRMSAGRGVVHSEQNDSTREPVHFLQIWIVPERAGLSSGYEQIAFSDEEKRGKLRLIVSPDGSEGSVRIQQNARIYATILKEGEAVRHAFAPGKRGWIHVVRGEVSVAGETLRAGDGVAWDGQGQGQGQGQNETEIAIAGPAGSGQTEGEVLLFDL